MDEEQVIFQREEDAVIADPQTVLAVMAGQRHAVGDQGPACPGLRLPVVGVEARVDQALGQSCHLVRQQGVRVQPRQGGAFTDAGMVDKTGQPADGVVALRRGSMI